MNKLGQYPYLKYPEECLFQTTATETKNHYGIVPKDHERLIERQMQAALADYIVHSTMETRDEEFHKEYRLRLYVFNEAQFHEMVRNEVDRQTQNWRRDDMMQRVTE